MRKTLFKLHSYAALLALLPILIVSLTGSLLVFKTEIDQFLMPESAALAYGGEAESRKPLNELKQIVEEQHPQFILGSWELFDDGQEADRVYLIKKGTEDWYKVYFDPYAGEVLRKPVPVNSDLTDWLLSLHYTFLLNDLREDSQFGTLVGLFVAIILSFLGVSGLIIHRKFWRAFFKLRRGKNLRVFAGDFHRLIGLWGSPILLILGLTGLYFNAVEYYHEVFEHGDEPHHIVEEKRYNDQVIDLTALLQDSQRQLASFTPTYLLMPYEPEMHITVFGYQPSMNPFASNYFSTVTYHRETGELLAAVDGRMAAAVVKVTDSFRTLHFGSFAGLSSKILWSLFVLAPFLLGISGFYIWLKMRAKRKKATIPKQAAV